MKRRAGVAQWGERRTMGNFPVGNDSPDLPLSGGKSLHPRPCIEGERFFPIPKPDGERGPDGDPRLRYNQGIPPYTRSSP
jgi:hypothetical protein